MFSEARSRVLDGSIDDRRRQRYAHKIVTIMRLRLAATAEISLRPMELRAKSPPAAPVGSDTGSRNAAAV
jgi:hypothetical protein